MVSLPAGVDAASCGNSSTAAGHRCPLVVGGSFSPSSSPSRVVGSDRNLFFSPNNAPILFTGGGLNLSQWRAQLRTAQRDQHSKVADPMFADAAHGDYSLKQGSPALALGFRPIPPIRAPSLRL